MVFRESKLVGVDFTEINSIFTNFSFEESRLTYSNFSSLKMPGSVFRGSVLKGVDFVEADLTGADFRGVEFSDCRIHQAKCERADFRNSLGFVIDPRVTPIRGAKFSFDGALTLLSAFEVDIS